MSTRINARIDDELGEELIALARSRGQTLTELVETALRSLLKKERPPETPAAIFKRTGLTGSGRGGRNLSRDYKQELTRSLRKKT
jgi:hypothetical protein